jgi:hypothetical protein
MSVRRDAGEGEGDTAAAAGVLIPTGLAIHNTESVRWRTKEERKLLGKIPRAPSTTPLLKSPHSPRMPPRRADDVSEQLQGVHIQRMDALRLGHNACPLPE